MNNSVWELPACLTVGGESWDIRTDFRAILDILKYFNDPDYEIDEKWEICLDILYKDYAKMPYELKQEAAQKAIEFIDMGIKDDGKQRPCLMDWEQDAPMIIPSVNRAMGKEIRALPYLHWWTFLGAYMEIGESLFSQIIHIRQKKAKGKKLEKWEQDFYRENKNLIDLKKKYSEEEAKERQALLDLF
jgi:hypothetical protein